MLKSFQKHLKSEEAVLEGSEKAAKPLGAAVVVVTAAAGVVEVVDPKPPSLKPEAPDALKLIILTFNIFINYLI